VSESEPLFMTIPQGPIGLLWTKVLGRPKPLGHWPIESPDQARSSPRSDGGNETGPGRQLHNRFWPDSGNMAIIYQVLMTQLLHFQLTLLIMQALHWWVSAQLRWCVDISIATFVTYVVINNSKTVMSHLL